MYNATKNDIKQFAQNIETLSKSLQDKLDKGEEYLTVANELVRNANTLVFTLGEVYALEQKSKVTGSVTTKSVQTTVVKTASKHYHNKRDAWGRFARV